MTRRKSMAGALVLCALSLCVFGANSAFANEGLTAVECENVGAGNGTATSAFCETPTTVGSFKTVAIPLNASKEVEGDSEGTNVLHGTVALSEVTVTCTKAHTSGKITNLTTTPETSEMQVHGTEAITIYSECEAHLKSKSGTEEACEVESITNTAGQKGIIETRPLTSTTSAEHRVTFTEPKGLAIAEFNILAVGKTGLPCNLPKAKVTVTGEAIADASTTKHSHLTFSGATGLKANGAPAQYTGTNYGYTKGGEKGKETIGLTTIA